MKAYGGVDVCTYLIFKIYWVGFCKWFVHLLTHQIKWYATCSFNFSKTEFNLINMYEHLVRTSQKTHYVFPAKTNRLVHAVLGYNLCLLWEPHEAPKIHSMGRTQRFNMLKQVVYVELLPFKGLANSAFHLLKKKLVYRNVVQLKMGFLYETRSGIRCGNI
jgi:hypothetical protein